MRNTTNINVERVKSVYHVNYNDMKKIRKKHENNKI